MRILLVAWGSRGDVAPFVALGRGLAAAGHEVTVAAADGFGELVTSAGLRYRRFAISLDAGSEDPVLRRWLAGSDSLPAEVRNMRAAAHRFAPILAAGLAEAVEEADALISGVLSVAALAPWAAAHHRPLVAALLQPLLPTRTGAALTHPARPAADSVLNLAAGWWQALGMHAILRTPIRQVHRALGVRPQGLPGYLHALRRTPTLIGASPLVVPQPADWPDHALVTGYWTDPVPVGYRPPAGLAAFLADGAAPVHIGFGSMPSLDATATRALVVEAVRRSGHRAILSGILHDGTAPVRRIDDRVLSVGPLPHDWLFPRTAGVVCHGGAGTTAAALRAGVPVGVVSHLGDQHYWGRRVHELGVGPASFHRRELSAPRLAAMIAGLGDPARRQRAAALGSALSTEDGVGRAVAHLEDVLRSGPAGTVR